MMNLAPMDDLVNALTDAVLRGERDMNRIARRYDVPQAEIDQFVPLIRSLKAVHTSERPSPKYLRRLKRNLQGAPEYTLIERVRYLPPRVQIAAGLAVGATFGLLIVGRFGVQLVRLLAGRGSVRGLTTAV